MLNSLRSDAYLLSFVPSSESSPVYDIFNFEAFGDTTGYMSYSSTWNKSIISAIKASPLVSFKPQANEALQAAMKSTCYINYVETRRESTLADITLNVSESPISFVSGYNRSTTIGGLKTTVKTTFRETVNHATGVAVTHKPKLTATISNNYQLASSIKTKVKLNFADTANQALATSLLVKNGLSVRLNTNRRLSSTIKTKAYLNGLTFNANKLLESAMTIKTKVSFTNTLHKTLAFTGFSAFTSLEFISTKVHRVDIDIKTKIHLSLHTASNRNLKYNADASNIPVVIETHQHTTFMFAPEYVRPEFEVPDSTDI